MCCYPFGIKLFYVSLYADIGWAGRTVLSVENGTVWLMFDFPYCRAWHI